MENIGSQPIVTLSVKMKVELIMITRRSTSTCTEQWYPLQSRVQVSERAMDNYANSYEWNNQGSMQKLIKKDEYPESKTV